MVSTVLIESDWNLKYVKRTTVAGKTVGINRIRLEFKGYSEAEQMAAVISINRIRLEFKEVCKSNKDIHGKVLIESDWNLKVTATADGVIVVLVLIESDWNLKGQRRTDSCGCRTGINRIRLEFKGAYLDTEQMWETLVLIESDWNLKVYEIVTQRAWFRY